MWKKLHTEIVLLIWYLKSYSNQDRFSKNLQIFGNNMTVRIREGLRHLEFS